MMVITNLQPGPTQNKILKGFDSRLQNYYSFSTSYLNYNFFHFTTKNSRDELLLGNQLILPFY